MQRQCVRTHDKYGILRIRVFKTQRTAKSKAREDALIATQFNYNINLGQQSWE